MEVKRERIPLDEGTVSSNCNNGPNKRIRRPTQKYAGELKGDDMEQAFDKAFNRLEKQSIKMYGLKTEKPDEYLRDKNQQSTRITYPVAKSLHVSEKCKEKYQSSDDADNEEYLPPQDVSESIEDSSDISKSLSSNSFNQGFSGNLVLKTQNFEENNSDVSKPFSYNSHNQSFDGNLPVLKTPNGGGICAICEKQFTRITTCKNHFLQVHGESYREKQLLCLVCKEAFAFDKNLTNHMKKIHNISDRVEIIQGFGGLLAKSASGKGVCLVCSKVFSRITTCKNHFKLHHDQAIDINGMVMQHTPMNNTQSRYNPILSKSIFEGSAYEIKHEASCNNNSFTIDHKENGNNAHYTDEMIYPKHEACNKELGNGEGLLDVGADHSKIVEVKMETVLQENVTNIQPKDFNKAEREEMDSSASKHSQKETLGNQKWFERKVTNRMDKIDVPKSYKSTQVSLPISKIPTGGGICEVCGKQFSRMDNCTNHFLQIHGESYREKDIFCLVCKEAFAFERNLSNHMKKVHNISSKIEIVQGSDGLLAKTASGKGVCLLCCKVFTRMDNCKNHFKLHQNQLTNMSGVITHVSQLHSTEQKCNSTYMTERMSDGYPNHMKYEANNNNPHSRNYGVGLSSYKEGSYPTFDQINEKNSSGGSVEDQLDSGVDPSAMVDIKTETIVQENHTYDAC